LSWSVKENFRIYSRDLQTLLNDLLEVGEITAIGIGIAGDVRNNKLYSSTNLPEWNEQNFAEILSNEFQCEVKVDNDAVVAAFGELYYGSGKELEEFLYITWGTGIGGAVVNNGENLSITKIDWDRYLENWENLCGGKSLSEKYGKELSEFGDSEWIEIFNIFESEIIKITDEFKINNIIFGGGATTKQKVRFYDLAERLKSKDINLITSVLNDDVGLYGGFALL